MWTFRVEAETAAARVVSVAGEKVGERSIGDAVLVSGFPGASCGFGVEIVCGILSTSVGALVMELGLGEETSLASADCWR